MKKLLLHVCLLFVFYAGLSQPGKMVEKPLFAYFYNIELSILKIFIYISLNNRSPWPDTEVFSMLREKLQTKTTGYEKNTTFFLRHCPFNKFLHHG